MKQSIIWTQRHMRQHCNINSLGCNSFTHQDFAMDI